MQQSIDRQPASDFLISILSNQYYCIKNERRLQDEQEMNPCNSAVVRKHLPFRSDPGRLPDSAPVLAGHRIGTMIQVDAENKKYRLPCFVLK